MKIIKISVFVFILVAFVSMYYFLPGNNSGDGPKTTLSEDLNNFIIPSVSVGGKNYLIVNGEVKLGGNTVTKEEGDKALRVGYATVLNRINPIYGIDGTDPEELEKNLEVLGSFVKNLASFYDIDDGQIISNSLYPIEYLKNVAEAEKERQEIIKSPSLDKINSYYSKLNSVIDLNLSYIDQLSGIFSKNSKFTSVDPDNKYLFFDGYTNKDAYLSLFGTYRDQIKNKKNELKKRIECLNELSPECPSLKSILSVYTEKTENTDYKDSIPLPENISNNNKIFSTYVKKEWAVFSQDKNSSKEDLPLFAVNNSPCFTNSTKTYYQFVYLLNKGEKNLLFNQMNDLYFYDLKEYEGKQFSVLMRKEVPFVYQPTTNLYMCTSSGYDLSRVVTLATVKELVKELSLEPDNIPKINEKLSAEISLINKVGKSIYGNSVTNEDEVDYYVNILKKIISDYGEKGLSEYIGTDNVLRIEKIISIYNQKSPHLDEIVRDAYRINIITEKLARDEKTRIPIHTMLYMRGYYPLLLLSYNKSVSDFPLKFVIPEAFDISKFRLTSYNDVLKNKYSSNQIINMLIRAHQLKQQ